jgi:hypothetical protein
MVGSHVAVSARPAVAAEALEAPIEKRAKAASDLIARLAATLQMSTLRIAFRPWQLRSWWHIGAGPHEHRRHQDEP